MQEVKTERLENKVTEHKTDLAATPVRRSRAQFFRYYVHDSVDCFRIELSGELTEADLAELNGCWGTARTIIADRALLLDVRGLRSADEAGREWLEQLRAEGAQFAVAASRKRGAFEVVPAWEPPKQTDESEAEPARRSNFLMRCFKPAL